MSRLRQAAATNSGVSEDEFKHVALALAVSQVFFYSSKLQRGAYQLIRDNRNAFSEVLDHLGLQLHVDDTYRMIYVVPDFDIDRPLPQDESLLAIVLRAIHHDKSSRGEAEAGNVTVSLSELYTTYEMLTKRELPKRGESRERQALFDAMQRYGLMREQTDDDGSPMIRILPGVTALLSTDTLGRLRPVNVDAAVPDGIDTEEDDA